MHGVVEVLVPSQGNSLPADNGADDTAGSCGRAVVVHPHRDGLADDSGEIRSADRDAPDGQAGIVNGVERVHSPESFFHSVSGLLIVPDFRRNAHLTAWANAQFRGISVRPICSASTGSSTANAAETVAAKNISP